MSVGAGISVAISLLASILGMILMRGFTPRCSLERKAVATAGRYRMFEEGARVLVCVSGGPDSVALFLFLRKIASFLGLELSAYHLNHMLRGEESDRDEEFVRKLARDASVPLKVESVDVKEIKRRTSGVSLQDLARRIRYQKVRDFSRKLGVDRIALGHTADDQVETFLMRVIQGGGLTGLGGIPPVRGEIVRPLISVWRDETLGYCLSNGVAPRCDSSNVAADYLRNRVRLILIPFLESEFGGRIKEVILREVGALAVDRDYLKSETARAFDEAAFLCNGEIRVDVEALKKLHGALRRGVIREAWSKLNPEEQGIGCRHVVDVEEKVIFGRSGSRLDLPRGVVVKKEYESVVFAKVDRKCRAEKNEFPEVKIDLKVPGEARLPWSGEVLRARQVRRSEVSFSADPAVEYVRPDILTPLVVRTPRPGDRFHPLGLTGSKKLSDLFTDLKVPRERRMRIPLVLSGDDIVWVAGFRLDERFRLRENDEEAVELRIEPPTGP